MRPKLMTTRSAPIEIDTNSLVRPNPRNPPEYVGAINTRMRVITAHNKAKRIHLIKIASSIKKKKTDTTINDSEKNISGSM